jgi:hydrogenase maturation factor HypF (carbamoyltransferase family)
MIDPQVYIVELCEDCGTRHSQVDSCPYDKYVATHFKTTLGPITPAFFRDVWEELTEKERERYA